MVPTIVENSGVSRKSLAAAVESAVAKRPGRKPPYHPDTRTAGTKNSSGMSAPTKGWRTRRNESATSVAPTATANLYGGRDTKSL